MGSPGHHWLPTGAHGSVRWGGQPPEFRQSTPMIQLLFRFFPRVRESIVSMGGEPRQAARRPQLPYVPACEVTGREYPTLRSEERRDEVRVSVGHRSASFMPPV